MPESVHMIQLDLDRRRLFELARDEGLSLDRIDTGYLIHFALRRALGEYAPQPFRFTEQGGRLRLLGYARRDAETLMRHAREVAEPRTLQIAELSRMASKEIPVVWPAGHRVGFELRICPIVRKAKDGPRHRRGAEVDVFLSACEAAGENAVLDRAEVYAEWARHEMEKSGVVLVRGLRVTRFQRGMFARSAHRGDRRLISCGRPDASLTGELEVIDPARFVSFLARGVGRHRAFGFGMLLLRPLRAGC